ncbi:hypothetical protein FIBSPDRAFT_905981, partial [Athelia psychrophila]
MPPPAYVPLHNQVAQLIARARNAARQSTILQYDPLSRDLQPWCWPVNAEGERLTPEALELLQNSADRPEDFKAPCCVCPHRSDSVWHLECEITMDLDGHYVGEYVARCAMEACKYLMPLDRLYNRPGLILHKYYNAGEPPLPVVSQPERTQSARHSRRGAYYATVTASANNATAAEPSSPASQSGRATIPSTDISDLPSWLMQLDPVDSTLSRLLRLNRDGLNVSEFLSAQTLEVLLENRGILQRFIFHPLRSDEIIDNTGIVLFAVCFKFGGHRVTRAFVNFKRELEGLRWGKEVEIHELPISFVVELMSGVVDPEDGGVILVAALSVPKPKKDSKSDCSEDEVVADESEGLC